MKKREKEELVSKSVIFTVIIFAIMFGTMIIQNGYFRIPPTKLSSMTDDLVLGTSIVFLTAAIAFVCLGFRKNQKYFEISAWFAGLATFAMLLKINYETKALEFTLPSNFFVMPNVTIKFYAMSMIAMWMAIAIIWVRTIIKIIKK